MFDFHRPKNHVFIHLNAAIYLIRVQRPFSLNVSKTFVRTLSLHGFALIHLVRLTFLTIRQLFTFVTCRLMRKRLHTTLIRSLIFDAMCLVCADENGLPYLLKTNTTDYSPCLQYMQTNFSVLFPNGTGHL